MGGVEARQWWRTVCAHAHAKKGRSVCVARVVASETKAHDRAREGRRHGRN